MSPINVEDFRARARQRLPRALFDYIDGGADDERTLADNTAAFKRYRFLPSTLVDVSKRRLQTSLFEQEIALPLLLSPTGMTRLFHRDKEVGVARAAARAGVGYSLSTLATTSIEDVAAVNDGLRMFQIYIFRDRGLTTDLVERCRASGYRALCLTVDTPIAGNRERDQRNGMTIPPRFTPSTLIDYALHPHWLWGALRDRDFRLANVIHRVDALSKGAMALIDYVNAQFDPSVTWDDARLLRQSWDGPFVIKGINTVSDALRARDIGATAIMISNHGGRQLDSVRAPLDVLQAVRAAVGDDIEVIVDGGVRRGADIVKALCLGATACSMGRPYLFALAAGGEQSVSLLLDTMRNEVDRTLALLGVPDINKLGLQNLVRLSEAEIVDARP